MLRVLQYSVYCFRVQLSSVGFTGDGKTVLGSLRV